MARLADYFVVVGYDHQKERCGRIIQRFPERDWSDTPFIEGIEWFCQPLGWALSQARSDPRFFVSVLTDIDANRHYCACLTFSEPVSPSLALLQQHAADDDEDPAPVSAPASTPVFAPKCLALVSRLEYFETFRNCLGAIYTAHLEGMSVPLETLVGNVLGCVHVPAAGGPQVRFSIGAGDRQCLQPPLSPTVPTTGTSAALLFRQLGVRNVLVLYCAAMTEHKILLHSKSYTRLAQACQALTALLFPFRYAHVYIPLLPAALLEVLSTPTPFIMGVHSSLRGEVDAMDVIIADIDGGAIAVPDCVQIPLLPDPVWEHACDSLSAVLQPELSGTDLAFPNNGARQSPPASLDKEVRATMLRIVATLLQGYRSCLTIIRIHPRPVIAFDKATFLSSRGMQECDFMSRLLGGMAFGAFVSERGPPWRPCDVWDEVYASCCEQARLELADSRMALVHVQELAQQLHLNENPNPQPYVQKVPRPPDGANLRVHLPIFPRLDTAQVQLVIEDGTGKSGIKSRLSSKPPPCRIVPSGPHSSALPNLTAMSASVSTATELAQQRHLVASSARRLEVLRSCVDCIFESKISEALKAFPAVQRALKARQARLALCAELATHVQGNKAMLEHQQFELIVRLMNCALADDCEGEHGVAAALLPLATAFCRRLCTGVIQFAYTCVQDHPVWQSQQFWESAFNQDVQKDIKALYGGAGNNGGGDADTGMTNGHVGGSPYGLTQPKAEYSWRGGSSRPLVRPQEPSALEIAAEQMRIWPTLDADKQKELVVSEESTIYSQAIHYANRMVYLLVPLDGRGSRQQSAWGGGGMGSLGPYMGGEDERASNSVTNSVAEESDSLDAESGFEEAEHPSGVGGANAGSANELGGWVVRFVSRFVDKVCTEGGVTEEHIRALHQMVPGVVAMQVETLDAVQRESRRLPPVQKPKILSPHMLPGEELVLEPIRVYLLPDGRDEWAGNTGPSLLPAEGALFLSSYRLVFKGTPCDPYACEQVIIRAFPVTSLTKEKRVGVHYVAHFETLLQEGLQMRSNTFQLLKLAFDEEVSSETVEVLRKAVARVRHPAHALLRFAFQGASMASSPAIVGQSQSLLNKGKEKSATLRGLAKKTLMRTARKAGFRPKSGPGVDQGPHYPGANKRHNKYILPSSPTGGPHRSDENDDDLSLEDADLTRPNTSGASTLVPTALADAKTLERLSERSYYKDWQRLGLVGSGPVDPPGNGGTLVVGSATGTGRRGAQSGNPFRACTLNCGYSLCRSYPAVVLVPSGISDDTVRRFCRCYRHARFPVVTWRHPKTKALLLRGAGFHGKGVIGMLRGGAGSATGSGVATTPVETSVEQERYLHAIVNTTPLGLPRSWAADSTLSIDSLLLAAGEHNVATPDASRRSVVNPFSKAMSTLRSSGGKSFGRWGSLKDRRQGSQTSLPGGRLSLDSDSGLDNIHSFQKAAMYIFGERSQVKGCKADTRVEFIPVETIESRQIKAAFKKLMRACVPSSPGSEAAPDEFFRSVEASEWLQQLQSVMRLAGAVVDLLDVQGSSAAICVEDGWDLTCQVASLAQLCLDPYYRTLEGFRHLVEKEWMAFGHRFGHRCGLGIGPGQGFAPVFLQWLDAVHQVRSQFPLSFEFNDFYLRFLAYHHVSGRFRTFLFDSELERVDLGVTQAEDKRGSLSRHHKGLETIQPSSEEENQTPLGQSVFDYIEKVSARRPVFANFFYRPDAEMEVLRPYSHLSNLQLWEYYLGESLSRGPAYDLEVVDAEDDEEEDEETYERGGRKSFRKTVTKGYEDVSRAVPDAFSYLLAQIRHLEIELGHLPQKWGVQWDKMDVSPDVPLTSSAICQQSPQQWRHPSHPHLSLPDPTSALVRSHGRSLHKRTTMEILVRGKMAASASMMTTASTAETQAFSQAYSQPHRFERYTFSTPTYCDCCSTVLWGLVKTGMHCIDCGYSCHDRCLENVPNNCTKYIAPVPATIGIGGLAPPASMSVKSDTVSVTSGVHRRNNATSQYYDQFSSHVAENRTHEGYLYKRGALLKGWKQRWFVLDSIKHQMRYYDAMEDSHCKGFVDLADVVSVTPAQPTPGAPKKTDDKSFFDLRTTRRVYNFCASDANSAQEWIEKVQACLQ